MQDLARQVQELLDRQAIRDVVYRYARAIDRHDTELLESCYHPDALDDHGSFVGGARGLAESTHILHEGYLRTQHHITNHFVELDGDTAHAETYYLVVLRSNSGLTDFVSGRYVDRLERRRGEWRISARVTMCETVAEVPTAEEIMKDLDRIFAPSTRDRDDLSYRRPLNVYRKSPEDPHPAPAGV
jgi:ketosteroid isomerase-like protein